MAAPWSAPRRFKRARGASGFVTGGRQLVQNLRLVVLEGLPRFPETAPPPPKGFLKSWDAGGLVVVLSVNPSTRQQPPGNARTVNRRFPSWPFSSCHLESAGAFIFPLLCPGCPTFYITRFTGFHVCAKTHNLNKAGQA